MNFACLHKKEFWAVRRLTGQQALRLAGCDYDGDDHDAYAEIVMTQHLLAPNLAKRYIIVDDATVDFARRQWIDFTLCEMLDDDVEFYMFMDTVYDICMLFDGWRCEVVGSGLRIYASCGATYLIKKSEEEDFFLFRLWAANDTNFMQLASERLHHPIAEHVKAHWGKQYAVNSYAIYYKTRRPRAKRTATR